jgi:Cdc6-like AAA superfamily ATPase
LAIKGLGLDDFKLILRENLTPAKAISNPHHLRGRQVKLRQIDRAFNSPGMHVFIYGDRGIGKTSLAQSAAVLHQSSDNHPIIVVCDQGAGFFKIVQDMANQCVPPSEIIEKRKKNEGFKLSVPGISYEVGIAIERQIAPLPQSINDAVAYLKYVRAFHSKEPVIIIDEFDQLTSNEDKKVLCRFGETTVRPECRY